MADSHTIVEWRPVVGFPGYEVSDTGRVRSWRRVWAGLAKLPTVLAPMPDKDGYHRCNLTRDGRQHTRRVAHIVAEMWHGPRPAGFVLRHLDGCRTNNTPANLRWGTHQENHDDAIAHGTQVRGHQVNTSRLTEESVRAILASDAPAHEIAPQYGVTPSTIYHIRTGHTWRHVPRGATV